jgi:hypothetical protein
VRSDSKYIFLAAHSGIYLHSRQTGDFVGCIPAHSNLTDVQPTLMFTAIHHDEKRDFLVALAGGYIVICNAYSKCTESAERLHPHLIFGRIRGRLGELSVENGRAVMAITVCLSIHLGNRLIREKTPVAYQNRTTEIQSLVMIHIPSSCSLIDSPPTIQLIQAIIPTDSHVSRIEQDSTHIYLTVQTPDRISEVLMESAEAVVAQQYAESTLGYWVDAEIGFLAPMRLRHRKVQQVDGTAVWPFGQTAWPNNAIMALSFVSPTDEPSAASDFEEVTMQ